MAASAVVDRVDRHRDDVGYLSGGKTMSVMSRTRVLLTASALFLSTAALLATGATAARGAARQSNCQIEDVRAPHVRAPQAATATPSDAGGSELSADHYFTPVNTPLQVPDPGVLNNDTLPDFYSVFVTEGGYPSHDASFYFDGGYNDEDYSVGGFYYCPMTGFVGLDHFTYEVCSYNDNESLAPQEEDEDCQTQVVTIFVGGDGCESGFPDVPSSDPFCPDVAYLTTYGFAKGYPDGNFHPTAQVTRAEAAAILERFASPGNLPACTKAPFPDVSASSPFCPAITYLSTHKVITGYADGDFHPSAPVTRAEAAAFMYRLENPGKTAPACKSAPFSDVPASSPFCGDIVWLVNNGVVDGNPDGSFHPTQTVLRQEIAAFVHRLGSLPD